MFGFKKQGKTKTDFFLGEMEENHSRSAEKSFSAPQTPPHPEKKPEPEIQNKIPSAPEKAKPKFKKPLRAKRDLKKNDTPSGSTLGLDPEEPKEKEVKEEKFPPKRVKKPLRAKRDLKKESPSPAPQNLEKNEMGEMVKKSLDGMYEVYQDPSQRKKNPISRSDMIRYGILFVCIFGFLSAGVFVFSKIYDYYRIWAVNKELQEIVTKKDFFQDEYLKKSAANIISLTPQDILAGKTESDETTSTTFTDDQQSLVGKIAQLKKINPDTAGWITINGTVVNYPVVWSEKKNYYLRRDFYGKVLSGGTIFIDERNSPKIEENRNTVIYGHNMTDGSMFASLHDFASSSVFHGATIQIATEDGIFIYEPFSAHESNAYDNYFETNFVSDEDFINFCEQMQFISVFQTDHAFDKNSQIITLSTCASGNASKDDRFAVHAVLTKVIR